MQGLLITAPGQFFSTLGQKYLDDLQGFLHDKLPRLIVIAIGAWIMIRILDLITGRIVRAAERHAARAANLAQVKTLTSVIRASGIGLIAVLAGLEILPLLGFNLGPLLTSAGVAGVAIGLAAQTIVKDCLNGFLILVEDQYNVGDVVRIAGLSGTVEAMSLRKTMVRDGDGTLYTIPNSQITTVANLVRDYSVATINVAVDFSANPDEVLKLLREVAMDVRNDPAYRDVFLADPTLLGVDSIKGSQVIYPVQLKTRANQQWAPMRELQRRLRIALEERQMLPGDPNRVFKASGATPAAVTALEAHTQKMDPTTAKPVEMNPFSGDGA
jgi:moderate conductance mechanosensitive channel